MLFFIQMKAKKLFCFPSEKKLHSIFLWIVFFFQKAASNTTLLLKNKRAHAKKQSSLHPSWA
jgi:hypothetical protein